MPTDYSDLFKPDDEEEDTNAISYRNSLINILHCLESTTQYIFTEGVNVLMFGELADQNAVFKLGETYEFSPNHMENSSDPNVERILTLVKHMRNAQETIRNINAISDEELFPED